MAYEMLLSVVSTLLTIYIISFIILLLLGNRDPEKTVAWILVVMFLPVIGLMIYFYLGQNWKKKQFVRHFQTEALRNLIRKRTVYNPNLINPEMEKEIDSDLEHKLIRNIQRSVGFGLTNNNEVHFFSNGSVKFKALVTQLKKAKRFIHMEYYRIRDDHYGKIIRDILMEKAKEGVEVKILFDFYGSFFFLRKYQFMMRDAGVDIHSFFNPLRLFHHYKTNYRSHRKIVIIDGETGFIGGMNIGEEYITGGKRFKGWKDFHFMLEGKIVHQIETIFLYDWYLTTRKSIICKEYYPETTRHPSNKLVQAVYSGPESKYEPIKQTYFLMIANAKRSVYITTPYFIPDYSIMTALKNAALSGVDVKVIVPSKPDHYIPFHASRTYFDTLLEAGVEFYEYLPGFMHAKSVMCDSTVVCAGTSNLDIRGFQVNFEANIVLYNHSDVEKLETEFKDMLKDSRKIDLEHFRRRKISQKLKQSLARLFSPIL
jgi:cardiolipin synthase A/B